MSRTTSLELTPRIKILLLATCMFLSSCATPPGTEPSTDTPIPRPVMIDTPETVELPAGRFYMGDQNGIGDSDERPIQQLDIASFAISKYEITFKQFDVFTDATARPRVSDNGWGRNQLPVINVNWHDAIAYTQWLTQQTGDGWRLPTEAEWEYAARAGLLTNYQSGNQPESVCTVGNVADETAREGGIAQTITACNDSAAVTNNVGSYRANSFGLYDMHGNVWEWTADCYHPYGDKSSTSNCDKRVVRGGSFQVPATSSRLSNREALRPSERTIQLGFRVVRDL